MEWIKNHWEVVTEVIAGTVVVFGIIFRLGKRKKEYENLQSTVDLVSSNQKKVISLIPKDSWEHGIMLINENGCARSRVDCRTRVIVDDLRESQSIQKEALAYLIRHDDRIPEDKRDELFEKLLK